MEKKETRKEKRPGGHQKHDGDRHRRILYGGNPNRRREKGERTG